MKVCVLAAGMGTRIGAVSDHLHKALLPVGNRAVLSHIIDRFPDDSQFIIATGNKAEQVESFVRLVHPGLKVTFVRVDPYAGPGSGPGLSLLSCRNSLREPFVFTACDTLTIDPLPPFEKNWIGVARVTDPENWCSVLTDTSMKVLELEYKKPGSRAEWAFTGIAFVKDHKEFWTGLEQATAREGGEVQVNAGLLGLVPIGLDCFEMDWRDTGNWESYKALLKDYDKNYTFAGKTTEITYRYDERVIKLYQSSEKAERWVMRAANMGDAVPEPLGHNGPVLAYRYVPGRLLSESIDGIGCRSFLDWLQLRFWRDIEIDAAKFAGALEDFYVAKSLERVAQFEGRAYDARLRVNSLLTINGLVCKPATEMVRALSMFAVSDARPSVFHGDLHADNVIKTDSSYCLIDWRDSFADLDIGDRYYDLAKFLHTLDFSVKSMEDRAFHINWVDERVRISHRCEYREVQARDAFWEFSAANGYNRRRIELINALIFLNMSPLYDPGLGTYLYLLGRYSLQKVLQTYLPDNRSARAK